MTQSKDRVISEKSIANTQVQLELNHISSYIDELLGDRPDFKLIKELLLLEINNRKAKYK